MGTTTGIELYRTLAEALSSDEQDVVTGIAGDHTVSSLTDAIDLYYSSADANTYDRKFIYLEALGEQSRVTVGGLSTAGVLTLSPNVTDAPTVPTGSAANVTTTATTLTDTDENLNTNEWVGYTVYAGGQTLDVTSNTATVLTGTGGWSYGGAGPGAVVWTVGTRYIVSDHRIQVLRNAINQVMRNLYVPSFFPLSLHIVGNDNNDMEGSGLDGDYSKSASAAIAAETTKVRNGAQSMKVTASAATQYAYTGNIPVNENQSLYAAIANAVDSGDSAEFRIVNVDDSNAAIENATNDEVAWMELVFQFSPPSGCERIQAWMISTANTDVSYWNDFQVWHGGRGVYQCPSWLTLSSQMLDVRAFPHGTGGPASDNDYRTNERMSIPLDWHIEREDIRGDSPLHLWVEGSGGARPYIYALRPLSELSSDSATTTADKDKVVFWAEKLIDEPDKASETLALMRATALARPVTRVSRRAGVRIG